MTDYERDLERRRASLSPNLSLSYNQPLKIVKGRGQYLYDDQGNRYLDCVNNVSHVGHCHPRVNQAIIEQVQKLNTNTRYLHDEILNFSEKLLQHFPEDLDTCFIVNSGSEANDLALRLADNFTGQKGKICQDAAYHGNLASLIDISPYKHNGPGGKGTPDYVRVLSLADPLRGKYANRVDETDSYINELDSLCHELIESPHGLSTFIAEAIPGCGGQIIPPTDYLSRAFKTIHRKGALVIADEVQTGLGRVGSEFWAYQSFNSFPDIVTIGKPLGNGHPVAAVVTKRAIADAFNNGMEYFNTFGGNPVSSSAAKAVLDVIDEEQLQHHAKITGEKLLSELLLLKDEFHVISDVRGKGLFIGIEISQVDNKEIPDAILTKQIVEKARLKNVLLSTDGPEHNVIKIKPPMVINNKDITMIVETLYDGLKILTKN